MALYDLWAWSKMNDLPNWLSLPISLILWPAALYWWSTHKRQAIPHLEIILGPAQTQIDQQSFDAVRVQFTNRTGSVVYLSRVRLRENKKYFLIPAAAARDISGGWRELKFMTANGSLVDHESIVQVNASAITVIATAKAIDDSFYSHKPGLLRRWFRQPQYFVLQYVAMVGDRKYLIETIY